MTTNRPGRGGTYAARRFLRGLVYARLARDPWPVLAVTVAYLGVSRATGEHATGGWV